MIKQILIALKRFVVLVPGIAITYFAVRDVLPYFDKRLPVSLAVLLTYVLTAYVMIPAAIRLVRIFKPAKHLPLYCVTPDGFASDPLNIGIMATRRQLITTMENSGWHQSDRHSFKNIARVGFSILLGVEYKNAPVSSLYLFGRKQDLAFQIPIEGTGGNRHHVRFWATTYDSKGKLTFNGIHWHNRQAHLKGDDLLWVGAASLDNGFGFIKHNLQITHMIDPDTNKERQVVIDQLHAKKLITKTETIRLGRPYKLINRVFRGSLHTDGMMTIVHLKK